MSFELKHKESIPEGIKRIVCERIDKALEALGNGRPAATDEAVHTARKQFKQVRGALRLVREELGEQRFGRENQTFRDAGRPLSAARDAKVLVDTLDELIKHFKQDLKKDAFLPLRVALMKRQREVRRKVIEEDRAMQKIAAAMKKARKAVPQWPLRRKGWKAIEAGLLRVYEQGRTARTQAEKESSDEALHEWRKRAKDLRYELELLNRMWPQTLESMSEQAHHLTDLLGQDHDLAVLKQISEDDMDEAASPPERELLAGMIDRRRCDLQKAAIELGEKLYVEPVAHFVDRLHGYWKAWS